MIDKKELATCKRRGHDPRPHALSHGWVKCKWCGTWQRLTHTSEERADEPPKDEQE